MHFRKFDALSFMFSLPWTVPATLEVRLMYILFRRLVTKEPATLELCCRALVYLFTPRNHQDVQDEWWSFTSVDGVVEIGQAMVLPRTTQVVIRPTLPMQSFLQ